MTKINRVIINPREGGLHGTTEWRPLLAFKLWGIGCELVQSTPDNSSLQGKSQKVQVLSYQEFGATNQK